MAGKLINPQTIKSYQYATTDDSSTYPTADDCGVGSTITLINETTHAVAGFLKFDGTAWNTL